MATIQVETDDDFDAKFDLVTSAFMMDDNLEKYGKQARWENLKLELTLVSSGCDQYFD